MSSPAGELRDLCPVCGVLVRLNGLPFAQSHVYGPVDDISTGLSYPGHPVKRGDALDPTREEQKSW